MLTKLAIWLQRRAFRRPVNSTIEVPPPRTPTGAFRSMLESKDKHPENDTQALAAAIDERLAQAKRLRDIHQQESEAYHGRTWLPLEAAGKTETKRRLDTMERRINALEMATAWPPLRQHCARLDSTPLTWRNSEGYPLLAAFPTEDSKSQFWISSKGAFSFRHFVPWLCQFYADVPATLEAAIRKGGRDPEQFLRTIETRFGAVIPCECVQRLETLRGVFAAAPGFQGFVLIAAVQEWTVTTIQKGDPILAAVAADQLWHIADFDLVGVEEAVVFGS